MFKNIHTNIWNEHKGNSIAYIGERGGGDWGMGSEHI